jgi:hypothetical protein
MGVASSQALNLSKSNALGRYPEQPFPSAELATTATLAQEY